VTIKKAMRAIHLQGTGAIDCMQVQFLPVPEPKADEVLIRVHAAGVNRPDILQRQGLYPAPPDASPILGLEVAGEVVACGSAVNQWQPGDKVCALVNGGGYAEYAVAPQAQCLPVPKNFSFIEAAALPEIFFTVWHNLWQRAKLTAGETLLIHGGSSGIGTAAIQMAVAKGITVFATAGSAEKCAVCEKLGAAKAINYRAQDFVSAIKNLTQGRGVDVILDMVGGDYIQRNISAAAKEGRIVNIAFLKTSKVEVDFMPMMLKRLTLTGSTLRAQSTIVKATIAVELQHEIWPLLVQGKITPYIAAQFPLVEVVTAHQLMESSEHIGKIILTI
jgi:putative PIG3 family NAD(P)H quinone oxidoreductase